jgi:glycosyltransferase involved in cell wall biosynthesis
MRLSIVIPCYNEQATIEQVLIAVRATPFVKEIIVVDDCSTDQCQQLLTTTLAPLVDVYLRHETNQGKGAAVRSGIKAATGDVVVIQDSDLEYDPNDYGRMIEPISRGRADVVFGSRYLGGSPHRALGFRQHLANSALTMLSNVLTNLDLTDMETGYKVFKREIIQAIDIRENRFGFEPEITAKLSKMNARIIEVSVSYYGRTYEEGKKIGMMDGLHALWCIFRHTLFSPPPPFIVHHGKLIPNVKRK